ncbi:MAG: tyrosine protein phosphatase [Desulfobacterales bacterium]|nr:tyrosine protein phosphatase [Desulfobacterales bacterium]
MARKAVEDGIHTIVATPHTLNGLYTNPAGQISLRVANLQKTLSDKHIELRLCVGADVHLCPRLLERIENGDATTINDNKKYILLEFPSQAIPTGVKDEIFTLIVNGITPIISHPERNPIIQHDINILYEFVRMGALSQITAMSITGDFGEMVGQCAEMLLTQRLAHVIASDAHSAVDRPPVLSEAVEAAAKILGSYEDSERMVTEMPAALLSGDVVEIPEPKRAK